MVKEQIQLNVVMFQTRVNYQIISEQKTEALINVKHNSLLHLVCSAVRVEGEVANSLKLEFVENFCSLD